MKVNGVPYRTIWVKKEERSAIQIIDQRFLPHRFVIEELKSVDEMARAIKEMHLRGAPLIGVAAAFGMYLAALESPRSGSFNSFLEKAAELLKSARPTGVNLRFAVDRQLEKLRGIKSRDELIQTALEVAMRMADEDVKMCLNIGKHGLRVLEEIRARKHSSRINILTHCNAGWLACIDWGTATSAIYQAFEKGMDVHVWVDETRPRNQGAGLTAWELGEHGVPHTVIVDNSAAHLMQRGDVDIVIVGTDRTTAGGDVANKIGTYAKALAARDNGIPFYAAVPSSSIDWTIRDGKEIPIEVRDQDEVRYVQGLCEGKIKKVLVTPEKSAALNYAFDVTPRRLVTGLITERGIARADEEGLLELFPEKRPNVSTRH